MNKPQAPRKPNEQDKLTTAPAVEVTPPSGDAPKPEPAAAAVPVNPKVSAEDARMLGDAELEATLKLLRGEVRRREGEREASRPRVGSKVRIVRGRPRYVGKVGTAVIVRRSRCFVSVPDLASPAYALISDIELLER
jgi:hypothetical protein